MRVSRWAMAVLLAAGCRAEAQSGWTVEGPGQLERAPVGFLAVRYGGAGRGPVSLRPPSPISLRAQVARLQMWYAPVQGDNQVRFVVKDGRGGTHVMDATDSAVLPTDVDFDMSRKGEWPLWTRAQSVVLRAPAAAEVRLRLRGPDADRALTLLWPQPLSLVAVQVVPGRVVRGGGGDDDDGGGPARGPAAGLVWLRPPTVETVLSSEARTYAYLADRRRHYRDEPATLFSDDLADGSGPFEYQIKMYQGYGGPRVWQASGTSAAGRQDPAALFDAQVKLPTMPVGRYFIDTRAWRRDGSEAGHRRLLLLVGQGDAGPARPAPASFDLASGQPHNVFPTATTRAALQLQMSAETLQRARGAECRVKVQDASGRAVLDTVVKPAASVAVPVPVQASQDYFAEASLAAGGVTVDRSLLHFGVASPPAGRPAGALPAHLPTADQLIKGRARLMPELWVTGHNRLTYPYLRKFDFAELEAWVKEVKTLGADSVSIKGDWTDLEPLPGVFRFDVFDRQADIFSKAQLGFLVGYAPYGGYIRQPRWVEAQPFRNQYGDFTSGSGESYPLAPDVIEPMLDFWRHLITHAYGQPWLWGYTGHATALFGGPTPQTEVVDYSAPAQRAFEGWLKSSGRPSARLTPLLTLPGVRINRLGPDVSRGWQDFTAFSSWTTEETARRVLATIRALDARRVVRYDHKSHPYAIEKIIPLLREAGAFLKNEGSPSFREGPFRSMAIQDGVPFVEELHRHLPTSPSLADATNYYASYLGQGAEWLLRWEPAGAEGNQRPTRALLTRAFFPLIPFLRETQPHWDEYLRGRYYEPQVLVVGSRTDSLLGGTRGGSFYEVSGAALYSSLFEKHQVPVHFADEFSPWVDLKHFKLVLASGVVMPRALVDRLADYAKGGGHLVLVGRAGAVEAESPQQPGGLPQRVAGMASVRRMEEPGRPREGAGREDDEGPPRGPRAQPRGREPLPDDDDGLDFVGEDDLVPPARNRRGEGPAPRNPGGRRAAAQPWTASDVDDLLAWAGVLRPVSVDARQEPGFQVQQRQAQDGTVYLAVMRNWEGVYRGNIEFENQTETKYGRLAATVTVNGLPAGRFHVEKFHRQPRDLGTFASAGGRITFPVDPAQAGEVQLIRIRPAR